MPGHFTVCSKVKGMHWFTRHEFSSLSGSWQRTVSYNTNSGCQPVNIEVRLLPINSLRFTRLSTSVKDVALWSDDSVVASSRSVTHKTNHP